MRIAGFILAMCGLVAVPSTSFAQAEVTGVVGGLLGGDLDNIIEGNFSVKGAFDNGPLYGVRAGWIHRFVGVEGSYVYSPTGVSLSIPGQPIDLDGKVWYASANALLIPIPGPISPFFTIGGGWQSYTLNLNVATVSTPDVTLEKWGWNFGGGLKINIKALTFRFDVRDFLTTVEPDDFNVGDIADALDIDFKETLHNVEISGGVGIRF
jgi:Outer membrane protein beta-barrel domain